MFHFSTINFAMLLLSRVKEDSQELCATRNWTMEFLQSVMTLATARIIGQKRCSRIFVVCRSGAGVPEAEGCDQLVDDDGETTLCFSGGQSVRWSTSIQRRAGQLDRRGVVEIHP